MNLATVPWDQTKRFFVPNEDARVVTRAMALLGRAFQFPVFVGGSGLLMLQAASSLAPGAFPCFVDISLDQAKLFRRLADALADAKGPEDLRQWFSAVVYPEMSAYYAARGESYPLEKVFDALENLFGIDCFFDQTAFAKAKDAAARTHLRVGDIVSYLARPKTREDVIFPHDFIYLSNVPDYLPTDAAEALFAACAAHEAPVYLLLTSACPDPAALEQAWKGHGYEQHPGSGDLSSSNRGLGSLELVRPWNRPGGVRLLTRES